MCHPKLERAWLFRTGWSTPHPASPQAGVWHHLECSHLLQKPQELSAPHHTVSARSQRTGLTQLSADCSRQVLQLLWGWCGLQPCPGGRAPARSQSLIRHRPLELVRLAVICHPDPTGCVKTTPGCLALGFSPALSVTRHWGFIPVQEEKCDFCYWILFKKRKGREKKQQTMSGMLLSICSSLKRLCMVLQLCAKYSRAALGCLCSRHSDEVLGVCKELPSSRDMNHSLLTG